MKAKEMRLLFLMVCVLFLTGCFKGPNHSIRVRNSYPVAMSDVKINSISYGRIESGSITDYKQVNDGNFTISGSTVSGQPLTGSGSISGRGKHNWTFTITSAGGLNFVEDK